MEEINIDIPKGYEFAKIDNDKQQIVFTKIQSQYPNDYEKCCEVLGILDNRGFGFINLSECENILMSRFIQLKRCRDAYWKIAGAEMGLNKPWEPDWKSEHEYYTLKYTIITEASEILVSSTIQYNAILAFPTEEMRDIFFENFRELIEECKELL